MISSITVASPARDRLQASSVKFDGDLIPKRLASSREQIEGESHHLVSVISAGQMQRLKPRIVGRDITMLEGAKGCEAACSIPLELKVLKCMGQQSRCLFSLKVPLIHVFRK